MENTLNNRMYVFFLLSSISTLFSEQSSAVFRVCSRFIEGQDYHFQEATESESSVMSFQWLVHLSAMDLCALLARDTIYTYNQHLKLFLQMELLYK